MSKNNIDYATQAEKSAETLNAEIYKNTLLLLSSYSTKQISKCNTQIYGNTVH